MVLHGFCYPRPLAKAKPNRKIGTESHGSTVRVDSRVAFGLKTEVIMRVSPVELDSCGSCNIQPFYNRLRSDEPSLYDEVNGKSTLYDSINRRSTLY